jgi:hypothetical protein
MFTSDDLRELLNAQPFVPFRLILSDGGSVEVRTEEAVVVGKRWAVIGVFDPNTNDTNFDRFRIIYYMHVARAEQLLPGTQPFSHPKDGSSGSPAPSPV